MDSLYIVMPAYNEEETIASAVDEWYPCLTGTSPASRMIVDLSGSTDRTESILKEMIPSHPQLRILTNGRKEHGPKLIRMYRIACLAGADYIFQTDSDGQTNPFEFSGFWEMRHQFPLQLGLRRSRGDGRIRKFVEDVLCILLCLIFQVRIPDANAPFRLMRTDFVRRHLKNLPSDYTLPNVMLTVWFSVYREPLIFREISFMPRQGGENSISFKKIVKIGFSSLKGFLDFRRKI